MAKNKPDWDVNALGTIEVSSDNISDTTSTTAGVVGWLVKNGSVDIKDIPDLDAFLIELRDKWLIGLPNYNNGTMYYVPEDTIKSYKSVSRVGSIKLWSDDEVNEGTKSFASELWSMATSNLSEVYVLDGGEYVQTDSNDSTFEVLGKNPQCVKISWLQPAQLEARKVLHFRDQSGKIVALNFINDEGLPYDLSSWS